MAGDGSYIGALYDATAEEYAARFATADVLVAEARYISHLASIADGRDVMLDIGCGPALYYPLAIANGLRYVGVDVSQAMIHIGERSYPDAKLIRASAEELPVADSSISVAVAMGSLSHLGSKGFSRAINEVARVLRPGGGFLLGDQLGEGGPASVPFPFMPNIEVEVLAQTPLEYHAALARAGFHICDDEIRHAEPNEMAMDKILIWAQLPQAGASGVEQAGA